MLDESTIYIINDIKNIYKQNKKNNIAQKYTDKLIEGYNSLKIKIINFDKHDTMDDDENGDSNCECGSTYELTVYIEMDVTIKNWEFSIKYDLSTIYNRRGGKDYISYYIDNMKKDELLQKYPELNEYMDLLDKIIYELTCEL